MRDAVQRSKGNQKQAQEARQRWKEESSKVRKFRTRIALGILGPTALLSVLYPLHSSGVIRFWAPSALSHALANPGQSLSLSLSGQYLDEIPATLEQLTELRAISLDSNKITKIGEVLAKLPKLENLNLSYNPLRAPFTPLEKCRALKVLNLSHTGLTELPPEVYKLDALEVLILKGNTISTLPEELGKLKNLRILDLRGNRIAGLPKSANSWSKLEELHLSYNPLSEVPNLTSYSRLKKVSLRDTGLRPSEIDTLRKNLRKEASVNS